MTKGSLEFTINVLGAAAIGMAGGAAGAYLSDLVAHSHELSAITSSISGLVSETIAYAAIHYYQEKKKHPIEEKFDYSAYFRDIGKAFFGLRALDLVNYFALRPIVNYSIQTYFDATPVVASLLSDTVHLAYHVVLAVPMGKLTGLIKKDTNSD